MFIWNIKLQLLKGKFKIWNKETLGDIHLEVKLASTELGNVQNQILLNGVSDDLIALEKKAKISLEKALDVEEIFWKDKSRINWNLDGDRTTAFFHRMAKIKMSRSAIIFLKDGDCVLHDPGDIAEHVTN